MGWSIPRCDRCQVEMQEGTLLDHGHGVAMHQAQWHEGKPGGPMKALGGFVTFPGTVVVEPGLVHQVSGYRCPDCGRIELYAR